MKKKKLNLNDLKVESFVTSIGGNKSQTVKGGWIHQAVDNSDHCSEVCSYLCEASAGICPSEDCETQVACFDFSAACHQTTTIIIIPGL